MDADRFDSLLRSLASSASRRGVLAGLTSGPLASLPFVFGEGAEARKKKKKKKKKNKKNGGGSSPPLPALPPSSNCPQPANPHWCASASTCVPACPPGSTFDAAMCECVCSGGTCCSCKGANTSFCSANYLTSTACIADCEAIATLPRQTAFFGLPGFTAVCDENVVTGCRYICQPDVCGTVDACRGQTDACGAGGQCFQPLGGGPTRCGAPTVAGSCGCTSHQQCADDHGPGAFCVTFDPAWEVCGCGAGGPATFCAQPR